MSKIQRDVEAEVKAENTQTVMAQMKAEERVAAEQPVKMVKLTINPGDGPDGNQDVYVGFNYHSYQIKRGEQVTVPEGVVIILKNAVNESRTSAGQPTRVPRYNIETEPV